MPLRSLACLVSFFVGTAVTVPMPTAIAQPDETELETQSITDNIHVVMGGGGNVGVFSGEDGVVLIDDSMAPLTEKLLAEVAEISDRPIKFAINTHWHFDHTGGNEALGESGTIVVAHDNVRQRMSVDVFLESFDMQFSASPDIALPVITFDDAVTFHINNEAVSVFHVESAHTDGDAIVYFPEANVIHAGDTYFSRAYPIIDVESGGSFEGIIEVADQLLGLADADTTIIPGHGPISNAAELETYRDLLVEVRERTLAAIAAGKSLEEFLESDPTADFDGEWGGGYMSPEAFQTIVFNDLSR